MYPVTCIHIHTIMNDTGSCVHTHSHLHTYMCTHIHTRMLAHLLTPGVRYNPVTYSNETCSVVLSQRFALGGLQDTEFPGVVARPIGEFRSTSDYQYQLLRCNVNLLKIIQIGLSFFDDKGNRASPISTWQFNFKFALTWVFLVGTKTTETILKNHINIIYKEIQMQNNTEYKAKFYMYKCGTECIVFIRMFLLSLKSLFWMRANMLASHGCGISVIYLQNWGVLINTAYCVFGSSDLELVLQHSVCFVPVCAVIEGGGGQHIDICDDAPDF